MSPKLFRYVFTDLITVSTDGWTDCRHQLLRSAMKMLLHIQYHTGSHSRNRSSPSGMCQTYCSVYRIHKIQRDTICIISHQCNPRNIRYQSVNILIRGSSADSIAAILIRYRVYIGSMGLSGCHHMLRVRFEYFPDPSVILHNIQRIIPSGKAEIHGRINSATYTTCSGGKQMFHHSGLFQLREHQILQFSCLSLLYAVFIAVLTSDQLIHISNLLCDNNVEKH